MNSEMISEFFQETRVRDIVRKKQTIFTLNWQATVSEALQQLSEHRILSAPVCKEGQVLGIVDTQDLVSHAVSVIQVHPQVDITQETLENLLFEGNLFVTSSVIQVARAPHARFNLNSTMAQVISEFATGIHRGIVFEEDKMVNILSQVDVLRYIALNVDANEFGFDTTVESLCKDYSLCKTEVVKVQTNRSAAQALKEIQQHSISGLAVVNAEDELVAVFSASDLEPLSAPWKFKMLALPILKYLEAVHGSVPEPKVFTMGSHLDDIIFLMAVNKLHRVFIINKEKQLQGLLTLTDIFSFFKKRFLIPQQTF